MLGIPLGELAILAAAIAGGGILTGIMAGLFGIGGGAVIVPVLYEVFRALGVAEGVRMQLCIGTSLAIIIPTSIRSFRAHHARGAVDMEILKAWWLPIVIGVIAGSITARYAPERLFRIVFVGVAWSAAARLLLARDTWKFGDDLPKGHRYNAACAAALASAGRGEDEPPPDDQAKAKLRQQAREWLQADLKERTRLLESGEPKARTDLLRALPHWKADVDLASIRDPEALAMLPEAERTEWQSLWAEVDALLKRAQEKSP